MQWKWRRQNSEEKLLIIHASNGEIEDNVEILQNLVTHEDGGGNTWNTWPRRKNHKIQTLCILELEKDGNLVIVHELQAR